MSFFFKLADETQIPRPPEATRNHNSIKLLIFLSLRADLLISVHSETPCMFFSNTILFPFLVYIKCTLLEKLANQENNSFLNFMCQSTFDF